MSLKEIMGLLECGYSVRQIAERLKVEPEAVRSAIAAAWGEDK